MSRTRQRDRVSPRKTEMGMGAQVDHYLQGHIPERVLKAGNISDRIPIKLSDGRTVVYMAKGKNKQQVQDFWEEVIHRIA